MPHLVLLGDSVFDNGSYVPGEPALIDQVRASVGSSWQATLLAVDGDVVADVAGQLRGLPSDATHLAISVGGNDALRQGGILHEPAASVAQVLARFAAIQDEFRGRYRAMLSAARARGLPAIVCTIYDRVPGLARQAVCALSVFNDVIVQEAVRAGAAVLDLRLICTEPQHYSARSPIEPSAAGGQRIAAALASAVNDIGSGAGRCAIYVAQ